MNVFIGSVIEISTNTFVIGLHTLPQGVQFYETEARIKIKMNFLTKKTM